MSEEVTLKKKIKVLIIFRVIFITLFFGSSLLFWGIERFPYIRSLSYLIISSYVATIVYLLLIERIRNLFAFAYVQLILDVIFEILFIYITGGVDSWFSFSIILTIIASSIVLNMRAGYLIATLSSILYGTLINLQLYSILPATSEGYMEARDYIQGPIQIPGYGYGLYEITPGTAGDETEHGPGSNGGNFSHETI